MKRALLSILISVLFSVSGKNADGALLQEIRHWSNEQYTRIVIDVDSPTEFKQNRLSNPDRLYFDLKNCSLPNEIASSLPIGDSILKGVRAAQFDKTTVRIVLDLEQAESVNVFTLHEPFRIIIDVYAKKKSVTPPNKEADKGLAGIKRIVIDAGHGGKDTGAIGHNGLYEKDVALSVAKKLGEILAEKYGVNVFFTRDRDVFIPLKERTAIANSRKADLFISIHANASPKRAARGIETYILNWTDDEEAIRVAARENAISLKKMREIQSDLQLILHDLARDNKRDESMRLAYNVQSSLIDILREDYRDVVDLGVKHALFYVLVGAEMPSVLAEISFISNPDEEKRLSDESYRNKIAEAIATGVKGYISPSRFAKKVNDKI